MGSIFVISKLRSEANYNWVVGSILVIYKLRLEAN